MESGDWFGSGDGRIVRIEERDGVCVVVACREVCERMTVVLYSEKVEEVESGSNRGWWPIDV